MATAGDDRGMGLPGIVAAAYQRAAGAGFELSSEPEVGQLLASLAAAVPEQGRILELGTGAGVGLAWLVHGLHRRTDVTVLTVDVDPELQALARDGDWPDYVGFRLGDGATLLPELGSFDLVFADAPGGKLHKLANTIAALRPGGALVVDDMDLSSHDDPGLRDLLSVVREQLVAHPELVCAELGFSSGVILAVKGRL
jgi:demethylmenaquinone methyltransferase/2-methoxy-6-polyprenyl-1,4-benzoquinol methylase